MTRRKALEILERHKKLHTEFVKANRKDNKKQGLLDLFLK